MTQSIALGDLLRWIEGDGVAIRGRAVLEPAGGPGDKVFPPSHSVGENDKRPGAKYAFETRRRGGRETPCVLLDSVQSQANRMEEALQDLWADRKLTLPVIELDLTAIAPEVGKVSSLSAPHRVADALLRDSYIQEDGKQKLFRSSTFGKSFSEASQRNAGPLFKVCPTALVFGIWDSTGPRGGLGAKFARALTSEIVGIGAYPGVKTASRIDPTGIVTSSATIYVSANPEEAGSPWTHLVMEAKPLDPKKPPTSEADSALVEKLGKKEKAGKPSSINHSNVAPTIDGVTGGVTIDYAEHTVVLSLAALRRLGFAEGAAQARLVLVALALVAILSAERRGHDLRSRCLLVPRSQDGKSEALALELVKGDGSGTSFTLTLDEALVLYEEAVRGLPESLKFDEKLKGESLAQLAPSPKLANLISKSRELAAAGADGGE